MFLDAAFESDAFLDSGTTDSEDISARNAPEEIRVRGYNITAGYLNASMGSQAFVSEAFTIRVILANATPASIYVVPLFVKGAHGSPDLANCFCGARSCFT